MSAAAPRAQPLQFDCAGSALFGLLHLPPQDVGASAPPPPWSRLGVVIVVGGPQYRVGSGRQFVLLARRLAAAGTPTLRFDSRGMGDSDGEFRGFLHLDDDIRAAVDALCSACPALDGVVLWGLCDAASAILFYAYRDRRVKGLALLNPWVHDDSEQGEARTLLRHYYLRRLLSPGAWRKLLRLRLNPARAAAGLAGSLVRSAQRGRAGGARPYQRRMLDGLQRFDGPLLLLLSGHDITASEFRRLSDGSPDWRARLADARVRRHELAAADHTFSRREWRDQVAGWTVDWLAEVAADTARGAATNGVPANSGATA